MWDFITMKSVFSQLAFRWLRCSWTGRDGISKVKLIQFLRHSGKLVNSFITGRGSAIRVLFECVLGLAARDGVLLSRTDRREREMCRARLGRAAVWPLTDHLLRAEPMEAAKAETEAQSGDWGEGGVLLPGMFRNSCLAEKVWGDQQPQLAF